MSTERAVLNVNGKPFDKGWDEIRVSSSMDALSITFDFTCTQHRPFNRAEWEIQMGSVCSVSMGGQLLATGYIEDIDIDYNATSHTVHIAGRDKLADIVDSASDGTVLHWKASSARNIISALIKPFGITLVVDPKVKSLMNEAVSPQTLQGGDGVFDIIMKILKLQGTVGIAMANGNMLVTEAGAYNGKEYRATDKIESGANVIRGALKQSDKDRFQYYFTKGYSESIDTVAGKHFSYFDKFKDDGIRRFRAMALNVETAGDFKSGKSRAKWEAKYRAGKSRDYGYSVQGWKQTSGALWDINMLVEVTDEMFGLVPGGIDQTLLINSIEFVQSASAGTMSNMKLVSPEKWKAQAKLDSIKAMSDGTSSASSYKLGS